MFGMVTIQPNVILRESRLNRDDRRTSEIHRFAQDDTGKSSSYIEPRKGWFFRGEEWLRL